MPNVDDDGHQVMMARCDFNKMQNELYALRSRVNELSRENKRLRCDLGLGHLIAQQLRDLCARAAELNA
jgi:hypothetical protein